MRVCEALKIPLQYLLELPRPATKFILMLYIKTDPFTNLTPCVHQHDSTVTFAALCHNAVINNLAKEIENQQAVVLLVPMRKALSEENQRHGKVSGWQLNE